MPSRQPAQPPSALALMALMALMALCLLEPWLLAMEEAPLFQKISSSWPNQIPHCEGQTDQSGPHRVCSLLEASE